MKLALHDFYQTLRAFPTALYFAWGDTKARYRRSILGPFWIVLGTAIGVVGLGVLWSSLLKTDAKTLIPSLTVGIVIWQLITGCVTESANVFIRNSQIIRNINTSFLIFPLQMVIRQLINFLHNLVVVIVILLIFPPVWSSIQLLSLLGLVLVLGNLLWFALLIGMLGARFRDLEQLIGAIMPMLFFLSPVIFRPDHLPIDAKIIWCNPFTYLITVIRDPLQGTVPDFSVYGVTLLMLLGGWLVALFFLNQRRSRLAFWV